MRFGKCFNMRTTPFQRFEPNDGSKVLFTMWTKVHPVKPTARGVVFCPELMNLTPPSSEWKLVKQ